MRYQLRNDLVSSIVTAIGRDFQIHTSRDGYAMTVPTGDMDAPTETLSRIIGVLKDHGIDAGLFTASDSESIVTMKATPELDARMLVYNGWVDRVSHAGPGSGVDRHPRHTYVAAIGGLIIGLPGNDHVMLSRDGDRIHMRFTRTYEGDILIAEYVNQNLPADRT